MPRTAKPTDSLDSVRHLMGKMPDHDIAQQCGSTPSIVGRYRRKHGIPAYEGYKFGMGQEPPSKKVTPEPEPKPAPVVEAAATTGRSKLDPFRGVIGTLSDAEVAAQAGVTAEAVRIYRRRHNIAPKSRNAAAKPVKAAPVVAAPVVAPVAAPAESDKKAPLRRASKLDGFLDLVGVVPDREVATMAGVTTENVRAFRRRHDIVARWREDGDEPVAAAPVVEAPKAAPAASPAPAPAPAPVAEPVAAPPAAKRKPGRISNADKAAAAAAKAATAPVVEAPKAAPVVEAPKAAPVVEAPKAAPVVEAPKAAPVVEAAPKAAAAVEAAPSAALLNGYAVSVKIGDMAQEYLVVATDIAAAANSAVRAVSARHGKAEITAIKHLGPALA